MKFKKLCPRLAGSLLDLVKEPQLRVGSLRTSLSSVIEHKCHPKAIGEQQGVGMGGDSCNLQEVQLDSLGECGDIISLHF